MEYYWSLAATIVIALVGWGWVGFQHLTSRKREKPAIVFEIERDPTRDDRYVGTVIVRNRSPDDIYVRAIALDVPALPMFVDDGGPFWSAGDTRDTRRHKTGREIAFGTRIKPYTGGTPDFPSETLVFWVDGVPADCRSFSIVIKIAPALDSRTFASFRRTWSIHRPNK